MNQEAIRWESPTFLNIAKTLGVGDLGALMIDHNGNVIGIIPSHLINRQRRGVGRKKASKMAFMEVISNLIE